MGNAKIRVLLIEPKEHPKAHTIEPTRYAFEKAVNVGAAYNGKVEAKKLEHGIMPCTTKTGFCQTLCPTGALVTISSWARRSLLLWMIIASLSL